MASVLSAFSNGAILQPRMVGCEYVNGMILHLLIHMKCNHDIRMLHGGDGGASAHYSIGYSCKGGTEVSHRGHLSLAAFNSRSRAETRLASTVHRTDHDKGRSLLFSLVYHHSSANEVSTAMAALCLKRGTTYYTSHKFVTVLLGQAVLYLSGGVLQCHLQREQRRLRVQADGEHLGEDVVESDGDSSPPDSF